MSKKRKQHTAEFKAMIGMEALKGIKTIALFIINRQEKVSSI